MASRKWNAQAIGEWVRDEARRQTARAEVALESDVFDDLCRLSRLDSVALQDLGARLGRWVWKRRTSITELPRLTAVLVERQTGSESLTVPQRSFVAVALALVQAAPLEGIEADQPIGALTKPAENVLRGRRSGESFVASGLVWTAIAPLLANDRPGFRAQIGVIPGVLIKLESAAQGGSIQGLLEMPLYWELKSLQWMLNGVLHASRTREAHLAAPVEASA